jgi:hypothetical protein
MLLVEETTGFEVVIIGTAIDRTCITVWTNENMCPLSGRESQVPPEGEYLGFIAVCRRLYRARGATESSSRINCLGYLGREKITGKKSEVRNDTRVSQGANFKQNTAFDYVDVSTCPK